MAKAKYTEPTDYIPKEIRKELKIGEFAEEEKKEPEKKKDLNKEIRDFVKGK